MVRNIHCQHLSRWLTGITNLRTATYWLQHSKRILSLLQMYYFNVQVGIITQKQMLGVGFASSCLSCATKSSLQSLLCPAVGFEGDHTTAPALLGIYKLFLHVLIQDSISADLNCRPTNLPLLNASICVSPGKQSGTGVYSELTVRLRFSVSLHFHLLLSLFHLTSQCVFYYSSQKCC